MGVPICGACRRPIEGRVVNALGKQWHVEVSETRRWGVPQARCYIRSLALQPLHTPTQALWLAPSRDLLLGTAAPPRPWSPWEPGDLSAQTMVRQLPPPFSSLSWPSRGFQSHEKTLGTVCLRHPMGLWLAELAVYSVM